MGCSLAISPLLFFAWSGNQTEGGGKVEGSSLYLPLYSQRDQVCDSLLSETAGLVLLPDFLFLKVFFFFFLMWTIFKVFVEFITILLLFYVLGFLP